MFISTFDQFCQNLISTWWFISFQLIHSILTTRELCPGTMAVVYAFLSPQHRCHVHLTDDRNNYSIYPKYYGNLQEHYHSHLLCRRIMNIQDYSNRCKIISIQNKSAAAPWWEIEIRELTFLVHFCISWGKNQAVL